MTEKEGKLKTLETKPTKKKELSISKQQRWQKAF